MSVRNLPYGIIATFDIGRLMLLQRSTAGRGHAGACGTRSEDLGADRNGAFGEADTGLVDGDLEHFAVSHRNI
jgi:hypothetical protein